jgi:hypothetical protein
MTRLISCVVHDRGIQKVTAWNGAAMTRVLFAILFGVIGPAVGYLPGLAFFSGKDAGNLCGLPAASITGPLVAAAGVPV